MRVSQAPVGRLLFLGVALLSAAAARAAGPSPSPLDAVRSQLSATRTVLIAGIDQAKAHSDDAYDIVSRLDEAIASLDDDVARKDPSYVAAAALEAALDGNLVDQVLAGRCNTAQDSAGTQELCFSSSRDRTLQPLAVVVPAGNHPRPGPLVVLLRGRGETETNLASREEVHSLANATGAVVALPYARGRVDYNETSTQDVIDATQLAVTAFGADPQRIYLGGFSAGGIAVFHVFAADPHRFAALLSIAGALAASDRDAAASALRGHRAYIVAGSDDHVVPAADARAAAAFLRARGIQVSYYEQPGGTHSLRSLAPAYSSAWHDMLTGTTGRNDATTTTTTPSPLAAPQAPGLGLPAAPGPGSSQIPH